VGFPISKEKQNANSRLTGGFFLGSAALAGLSHGRDLTEVFRPALSGLLTADTAGISGNLGIANRSVAMGTSKHISTLKQALLLNKKKDGELNI